MPSECHCLRLNPLTSGCVGGGQVRYLFGVFPTPALPENPRVPSQGLSGAETLKGVGRKW